MVRLSGWRVLSRGAIFVAGAVSLSACTMSLGGLGDSEGDTTVASESGAAPSEAPTAAGQPSSGVQLIRSERKPEAQTETPAPAPKAAAAPAPRPKTPSNNVQLAGYDALAAPMKDVSTGPMNSPADVDEAIGQLKQWEPNALSDGLIEHKAAAALTAPAFVEGVRAQADAEGADNFLAQLEDNPSAIRKVPGAKAGLAEVTKSLRADANGLKSVAAKFSALFESMAAQSGEPMPGNAISDSSATLPFTDSQEAAAAINDRILVIAAHRALGREAGPAGTVAEPLTQCLRFARLNLNQCLAAKPGAADSAYCAGRHGADEVAGCIDWLVPGSAS